MIPWALSGIGFLSLILVSRKRPLGWLIGSLAGAVWIPYAIASGQAGFVPLSIVTTLMQLRAFFLWRRAERA